MEAKTKMWIFIIVILALVLLGFYLYKSQASKQTTVTQGGQQQTQVGAGGLFSVLSSLIGGIHFGQNLNASGVGTVNCDPSRPGFDVDGTANALCGKDYTGCKQGVCDPMRPGLDQCGFPNTSC